MDLTRDDKLNAVSAYPVSVLATYVIWPIVLARRNNSCTFRLARITRSTGRPVGRGESRTVCSIDRGTTYAALINRPRFLPIILKNAASKAEIAQLMYYIIDRPPFCRNLFMT